MIEKTGVRPILWAYQGARWMFFVNKINSIEDFKKVNLRVADARTYRDMANILGAKPISVSWGDVYTALESGLADAVEGVPKDIYSMGYHEPCNYFSPTNHMQLVFFILIDNGVFESLPSEVRNAMNEAAEEVAEEVFVRNKADMDKYVDIFLEEGLEMVELDLSTLKERAREYHMKWAEDNNAVDLLEEFFPAK